MNLTKRARVVVGATALLGAVAAIGGASTAGGVSDTSGDGFVGGTVTQAITGAEITNVAYTVDGENKITAVDLAFAPGVDGKAVAIAFDDGLSSYDCSVIDANASSCTASTAVASKDADALTISVSLA